jgi:hypothetical protein
MELLKDIFDDHGEIKNGIQIFNNGEDVTNNSNHIQTFKNSVDIQTKLTEEKEETKPEIDALNDKYDGSYFELRNLFRQKTKNDVLDYLYKIDRRRICVLREHFITLMTYTEDDKIKTFSTNMICLITKIILGDDQDEIIKCSDTGKWIELLLNESINDSGSDSGSDNDSSQNNIYD